jgi:transketolase
MIISQLKKRILEMSHKAHEGHIPSAFSILDILWVLYDKILKPDDKFILSKGHGCMALYVVLAEKGIISKGELDTFCEFDSNLGGHPDSNKVAGVLASTGSLGHGLPIAVGMAMAFKINKNPARVYCLIGDGECNEGSIWEAVMIASHQRLDNITCIVDYNHSTDRALRLGNLGNKFSAFGWAVCDINGHDHNLLYQFISPIVEGRPTVVIANTIKGKGIDRMESNPEWHHKSPTKEELTEMIRKL